MSLASGASVTGASAALKLKTLSGLLWLKWLAVGFSVGMLGAGTASYVTRAPAQPGPPPQLVMGAAKPRSAAVATEQMATGDAPKRAALVPSIPTRALPVPTAPVAASPATLPDAPPHTVHDENTFASAASASSALREEMAAIKSARTLLARGNASSALDTLAAYDAQYPTGQFQLEAQLLRVDALFARGEREAARGLARRLLNAQPNSPYAHHLSSLVEGAPAPNP